jgi:SOS response regulatory protein OraA/RecX
MAPMLGAQKRLLRIDAKQPQTVGKALFLRGFRFSTFMKVFAKTKIEKESA